MSQSSYKSNSELKLLARIQTGQRLGLLIGTVLLHFIITYAAVRIVSFFVPVTSTVGYVINYILVFFVQIAVSLLNVGVSYIFLKSACNMPSTIGDLFYGFKHNSIKILKIGTVIAIIESICMLPSELASIQLTQVLYSIPIFRDYDVNSFNMLLMNGTISMSELMEAYSILSNVMIRYSVIILICSVISTILTLSFFPAYYMVLDFPDWDATTILKRCFEVMKGNKIRLFVFYLSFIPICLLSIVTCGLALLWIIPYMNIAMANFYLDLMAVRNHSVNA